MDGRAALSNTSTEPASSLRYEQWLRASRALDYAQWRKNQLGVGFEQWILDQPEVPYEQWVKTKLGKDYERLITAPLSVKPPPRTIVEHFAVRILPLGISYILMGFFGIFAYSLDLSYLASVGTMISIVGWPYLLTHEPAVEYQIAALESRPDDMTRNIWLAFKVGYRRQMALSKWKGYKYLATLLFMVALTLASLTLLAVELTLSSGLGPKLR